MKRERFNVPEEEIDDFTNENCTWEIKGENYKYVDKIRVNGDGEWWGVIVQRESDGKYFQFDWGYSHGSGNYYYEPEWVEVKPIVTTTTKWEWNETE